MEAEGEEDDQDKDYGEEDYGGMDEGGSDDDDEISGGDGREMRACV